MVAVLEIGSLLPRFPRNLSGGERQRVALGRALLSGPELLLMDEPLASLDAPLRDRVLSYLERAVAEWNIPTLFVTHAQAEVRRAAQWVILMEKGRVVGSRHAGRRPEPAGTAGLDQFDRPRQPVAIGERPVARRCVYGPCGRSSAATAARRRQCGPAARSCSSRPAT